MSLSKTQIGKSKTSDFETWIFSNELLFEPAKGDFAIVPIRWFKKMFCKHKDKTELHRCYQDRYVSEVCIACGKIIYSDL